VSARTPKILVVEDEVPLRELLERQLTRRGYEVTAVGSAEEALERADDPDVALCDISLPGMSGIDLVRLLKERLPATQSIVLTGQGSIPTAIEAMKLGAYHYFEKPVPFKELELYVKGACDKRRLSQENTQLKAQLSHQERRAPRLVGDSPAIRALRTLIERVAAYPTPVLIEGETGTGKDLVARAIHDASPRADKAYVAINCGALSETLLENELFGHVAGAFTGATKEQRGLFEVADGGTLFIDEVAEMSLEIQKKFLRLLENGEFRRLGEAKVRVADVRVVAATNRVLKERVAEGAFREDLYYRLEVLSVRTPPLREHLEDLPLLLDELLERAQAHMGREVSLTPEAVAQLQRYHWPGNVRELRNVLERAAVLSPAGQIRPEDCPGLSDDSAALPSPVPASAQVAAPATELDGEPSSQLLEDVEKTHIHRVMIECEGNKTEAAKRLGLSLRSLYRRLDKLGIKG
jgi:DNA-binding NtrC family response regulator